MLKRKSYNKYYLMKEYQLNLVENKFMELNRKKTLGKNSNVKMKFVDNLLISSKSNYIKRWVVALLDIIPKHGKIIKYNNYIWAVLKKIKRNYDLFSFFSIIEKKLLVYFNTFKKRIAGKNILIPISIKPYKRIYFIARFIFSSLKLRKEKTFIDQLYNELLDTYNSKGFSIIKKFNFNKQIKDCISNIRYLNEKY